MIDFFSDDSRLTLGDAVAAILQLQDGRYILQHRDDIAGIWYPNTWGCFGGGCDPTETPLTAIRRELEEEIGFTPSQLKPFCSLNFDMSDAGFRIFYRRYYHAVIANEQFENIRLGEGNAFAAFSAGQFNREVILTPYDNFALLLHSKRKTVTLSEAIT